MSFPGQPVVSCLMVTQASRWRDGVPVGAQSYLEQTYVQRELLVVSDLISSPMYEFAEGWPEEVRLIEALSPGATLGALREESVGQSWGQFVAQWDDDDASAPERLSVQMDVLAGAFTADACLLARWRVDDPRGRGRFVAPYFPWEGSMVARREAMPHYDPSLRTGEDTALVAQFRQIVLLDRPDLYVYRVHGANTVGSDGRAEQWWEQRTGGAW